MMKKYMKIAKIFLKNFGKYIEKTTFEAKIFPSFEESSSQVIGVVATVVVCSKGHFELPTYVQVSTLNAGHSEACQAIYHQIVSTTSLAMIYCLYALIVASILIMGYA